MDSTKPLWRGQFHQAAFFFSLGACALLILRSQNIISFIATLVYSLSLCGLFGISALYHRVQWSAKNRVWLRRLDHAAIFILIAGTATPICLLALPIEGAKVLTMIWLAAGLGVLQSLFWVTAPKWLAAILYVVVGWLAVPYLPEFHTALGSAKVFMLLLGGVLYTLGALVYAFKYPNPWPKYFGYHEIFHLLVIGAAFFHFVVVYQLLG
jgi:hemolysin III